MSFCRRTLKKPFKLFRNVRSSVPFSQLVNTPEEQAMKLTATLLIALSTACAATVQAVTIDLVTVGNPGNPGEQSRLASNGDTTFYGGVDHAFAIGKFEITAWQYCEFLNAVAGDDTYALYNTNMTGLTGCKIQRTGSAGSYSYSVASEHASWPVDDVTWGDAARFCNWLHNGQPTGPQSLLTTEDGAYYLNGANGQAALMSVTRRANAKWWLPTEDEWYKAAYHKNNGATADYFNYPTSSDTMPSNDLIDPDPGNTATYWDGDYTAPSVRTDVGAHENSESPYGTYDQGGNVWEWTETPDSGNFRVIRGGAANWGLLHKRNRSTTGPMGTGVDYLGFRVATVPEPNSIALLGVGAFVLLAYAFRRTWTLTW
jgi:formylglycine-generating enzyme